MYKRDSPRSRAGRRLLGEVTEIDRTLLSLFPSPFYYCYYYFYVFIHVYIKCPFKTYQIKYDSQMPAIYILFVFALFNGD